MVEAVAESMSPTQVHKGDSRLGHGGSFAAVASTFQASFAVALTAIIDLEMALGQCQKLVPQANHAVGAPPPPPGRAVFGSYVSELCGHCCTCVCCYCILSKETGAFPLTLDIWMITHLPWHRNLS